MPKKLLLARALLYCMLPCAVLSPDHPGRQGQPMQKERTTFSGTENVKSLLALAHRQEEHDSLRQSMLTAAEARTLAEKLHDPRSLAESLSEIGAFYEEDKKDYSTAARFALQAIHIAADAHLWNDLFLYYGEALNCYFYLGDFTSAMGMATKGLAFAEQLHDRKREANYDNVIGFIYLRQQNGPEALRYYQRYLKLATTLKDKPLIADAYNSIADAHTLQGDYAGALAFHFQALELYHQLQITERMAYCFYKISYTYRLMANPQAALPYALKAVTFIENSRYNQYDLASYYINLGEIYRMLNKPGKAIVPIHKGLNIARTINHSEDIRDAYAALSLTYARLGKYDSAYMYDVWYNRQKDSIINEHSRREIEQIHTRFQVAGKDREIALLHQREQINQAEIARARIIKNALIVLFILLVFMIILLYNRRQLQQKNRLQAEKNKYHDQLFNLTVSVEDKERKRIAQDIHDSLGSLLSATRLKLSGMDEGKYLLPPEQLEKYEAAVALLDDAVAELRNISHNIMPATLSRLGLIPALKNLFDNLSSSETLICFTSNGFTGRLEETMEISIYRIVLELVNNVIKHAEAKTCTVQLVHYADHINIMVEDNGKGLRESHKPYRNNGSGMGMGNILSRVEYLKGRMEIDSKPMRGTTVIIDVPLTRPGSQ